MTTRTAQLESILFVASRPLTTKILAAAVGASPEDIERELADLQSAYASRQAGLALLSLRGEWQLATHPDNQTLAEKFIKAEVTGDLTRPQLETLTVVAYCGPITKPELEQIRGVNCSLILRNLMLRGLVGEAGSSQSVLPQYEVTMEYLRHLGLASITELPDYATLHNHEYIAAVLKSTATAEATM